MFHIVSQVTSRFSEGLEVFNNCRRRIDVGVSAAVLRNAINGKRLLLSGFHSWVADFGAASVTEVRYLQQIRKWGTEPEKKFQHSRLSLLLAHTCTADRYKSFICTHIVNDPRGGVRNFLGEGTYLPVSIRLEARDSHYVKLPLRHELCIQRTAVGVGGRF